MNTVTVVMLIIAWGPGGLDHIETADNAACEAAKATLLHESRGITAWCVPVKKPAP